MMNRIRKNVTQSGKSIFTSNGKTYDVTTEPRRGYVLSVMTVMPFVQEQIGTFATIDLLMDFIEQNIVEKA